MNNNNNKKYSYLSTILLLTLITSLLVIDELYGKTYQDFWELKTNFQQNLQTKMKTIKRLTEVGINELKINHFKSLIINEIAHFDSLGTSPKFNDLMTKTFLSFALTCQVQKCELEIDPNSPENKQKAYEIIDAVFNEMKVKLKEQFPNYCININSNSNSDQQIDNNSN